MKHNGNEGAVGAEDAPEGLVEEFKSLLSGALAKEQGGEVAHDGELGNDVDHIQAMLTLAERGEVPTAGDVAILRRILSGTRIGPDEFQNYEHSTLGQVSELSDLLVSFSAKQMLRQIKRGDGKLNDFGKNPHAA